jgi:hypothetical protein
MMPTLIAQATLTAEGTISRSGTSRGVWVLVEQRRGIGRSAAITRRIVGLSGCRSARLGTRETASSLLVSNCNGDWLYENIGNRISVYSGPFGHHRFGALVPASSWHACLQHDAGLRQRPERRKWAPA